MGGVVGVEIGELVDELSKEPLAGVLVAAWAMRQFIPEDIAAI